MKSLFLSILIILFGYSTGYATEQSITLDPGDSIVVNCTDAQVPTWVTPKATCPHSDLVSGQPCPQWYHDVITVVADNGKTYATWHPSIDSNSGCYFGHEHGANPTLSVANNMLPPFGYIADLASHDPEPHEGFKVFLVHYGTPGDNGPALADSRIVFHMGTSRIGRYTNQHHSMMFDAVYRDGSGRNIHVQGMTDTGVPVGSTCDNPRKGGRDFSTVGCSDSYEIWSSQFVIKAHNTPFPDEVLQNVAGVLVSVAAFDPVTTRNPADSNQLIYTEQYRNGPAANNPLATTAAYRGCSREHYVGPVFVKNYPGWFTTYWTDARGTISPTNTQSLDYPFKQEIANSVSTVGDSFKYVQSFCDISVHAPN